MRRRLMLLCAVMSLTGWCLVGTAGAEPPARTAVTADPSCGSGIAAPGGGLWKCTFSDDFNGRALDRGKWLPQAYHGAGGPTARSCFVDDPRTIAVASGELRLTVRKVDTPVVCDGAPASYISGNISTYHLFSQQYGRFAARIKSAKTTAPGLQEAFWLWPDDRVPSTTIWPAAGEIDIAEMYSQYYWLAIPFLHYTANDNGGPIPGTNTAWDCAAKRGVFNTYVLTWTPTSLKIDVNGKTCLVNTSGDPAFKKPYIVALTSALGVGGNALTNNTPIPATTSVDYVRVWQNPNGQ